MDIAVALRFGVAALLGRDVPLSSAVALEPRLFVHRTTKVHPILPIFALAAASSVPAPAPDAAPAKASAAARGLSSLQPQDYTTLATFVLGAVPMRSAPTAAGGTPPVQSSDGTPAIDGSPSTYATAAAAGFQAMSSTEELSASFEAHAPAVFRALRRRAFGMGDSDFFETMCRLPVSGAAAGAGKSGSYFMFSADRRLIVKSVKGSEFPFLVRVLAAYVSHMEANHFHSLLPRFLGLYKVGTSACSISLLVINT
jgi:hypothetical protein